MLKFNLVIQNRLKQVIQKVDQDNQYLLKDIKYKNL